MSNYRKEDLQRLAQMFAALSNPNRLDIFLRLVSCCPPSASFSADPGPCACVGELGQDKELAPSTISHHLKELNRAGLIEMERRGQKVACWVNSETLQDLTEFFKSGCCKV